MSKIYWDSCAWIAYLNKEERVEKPGGLPENRYRPCLNVMEAAKLGKCEIVSSVLSIAEACKVPKDPGMTLDLFQESLDRNYFLLESMYESTARKTKDMMIAGHAGLKLVDAMLLATAIEVEVSEFHTYDRKLLNLDGKLPQKSGGHLRICKPDAGDL